MSYHVLWMARAVKQARRIPHAERVRIVESVGHLSAWPACMQDMDIKPLKGRVHQ